MNDGRGTAKRRVLTPMEIEAEARAVVDEELRHPEREVVTGSTTAVLLACGFGCLAFGLMSTLAAASPSLSDFLSFYPAAGPLSGEATVACVLWLAWLHTLRRSMAGREFRIRSVSRTTLVLIAGGFIGTLPLVALFSGR